MAQRQVTILDKAAEEVAYIAYFIETQGLPKASKKEGYRCTNFRKKYAVAYLDLEEEVVICDFAPHKLLV